MIGELIYDALDGEWPQDKTPSSERRYWPGSYRTPPWHETEQLLLKELDFLRVRSAVLRIDTDRDGFRRDGNGLKANAKVGHPGVMLNVETVHGPLTFATDLYLKWTDNVRAIALALEGLRRLDRYGITRSGNQYHGWKALPAGSGGEPEIEEPVLMSHAEAVMIVCEMAASPGLTDLWASLTSDVRRAIIRSAQKVAHPDSGGSAAEFDMLTEAMKVIGDG